MLKNNTSVSFYSVSSSRIEHQNLSISSQQKSLEDYALKNNLNIVENFLAITDKKGKVFSKALDYIINYKVDNLLVCKIENLTRKTSEWNKISEWLGKDINHKLHIVDMGLVVDKKSKADDKLYLGLHVILSEAYSLKVSERLKRNKDISDQDIEIFC